VHCCILLRLLNSAFECSVPSERSCTETDDASAKLKIFETKCLLRELRLSIFKLLRSIVIWMLIRFMSLFSL